MFHEFLIESRDSVVAYARSLLTRRSVNWWSEPKLTHGLPLMVDEMVAMTRLVEDSGSEASLDRAGDLATKYSADLLQLGFTMSQLACAWCAVFEAVMREASKRRPLLKPSELTLLDRVVDTAIAAAADEYGRRSSEQWSRREFEFLGVLAHELRNALMTAMIAFRAIRDGEEDAGSEAGHTLDRSLLRMRELIDRALADAKVRGEPAVQTETVRVADLVDEVVSSVHAFAAQREIRMDVTVDRAVEIVADRQLLVTALTNILQNAVEYTRRHGAIAISSSIESDAQVEISIEDQCGGMPAEQIEELRGPDTSVAPVAHAHRGFGVRIAQRSVALHGGSLRIENRPGRGCRFSIELPRKPAGGRHN